MIEEVIQRFEVIQKELNDQVSVPLSYMGEFYRLRLHFLLVSNKLRESRTEVVTLLRTEVD